MTCRNKIQAPCNISNNKENPKVLSYKKSKQFAKKWNNSTTIGFQLIKIQLGEGGFKLGMYVQPILYVCFDFR